MRKARYLVAILLLALWSATPAMACLAPAHSMSAEEMACCVRMQNDCDGMAMDTPTPASIAGSMRDHSCCKKIQSNHPLILAANQASFTLALDPVVVPGTEIDQHHGSKLHGTVVLTAQSHSPPGSRLGISSILRI